MQCVMTSLQMMQYTANSQNPGSIPVTRSVPRCIEAKETTDIEKHFIKTLNM